MEAENQKETVRERFNVGASVAFFLVGIIAGFGGYAGWQFFEGKLYFFTSVLVTVSYLLFGLLVITFVIIFYFRSYLSRKLFGVSPKNMHTALQDTQRAANYVTDRVAAYVLRDAPDDIRTGVRSLLPRLAHQVFWARLRNWWWQWILGIFVAIGGLTGTLLLMNQNKLLESQNEMIKRQMSLEEANRRSALVMLMSNIMDKVDREIETQQKGLTKKAREASRYSLSASLIGQIAALSHAFKPYKYMEGEALIPKALSPERGQLLTTLTALPLDTGTMNTIYRSATFRSADLKLAVLKDAYLSGADLREANLQGADLSDANLVATNATDAVFREVDARKANLQFATLSRADFTGAILRSADLSNANADEVILSKAELRRAVMENTHLARAVFSQTTVSEEQAAVVSSLYQCQGLNDTLRRTLEQNHPHLFKNNE
jgi:hypothetical protein